MSTDIRVLLVDDDSIGLGLLRIMMNSIGYHDIQTAANGEEAVRKATDYSPHLIIMDTRMPGLMGYDACKQIRKREVVRNTAIIGISGSDDRSYRELWDDAGVDRFLLKSLALANRPALEAAVTAALRKYSPPRLSF